MTSFIDRDKYEYARIRIRDKHGKVRHSAGNRDAVATALLGLSHTELQRTAKANGLAHIGKTARNPGQYRMLIGNSLRALVRHGTPVGIGAHQVKTLKQRIPAPAPVETKARAATAKPKNGRRRRSGNGR